MKIKTLQIVTVMSMGVLFLTGCSSNQSKSNNSFNKKTTTTVVNKKTSTVKNTKALWNDDKDAKLKKFINQWAPTMNQTYLQYDGKDSIKTSAGTTYPDDLKHVTVAGNKTSISWNKNGNGNYKYNVVAIYNYNGSETASAAHITYFFAFHNDKPVVLVDQSTNGTPDLLVTKNNVLQSGFVNIVNGKKANIPTSTTSTNTNSNNTNNGSNDNDTDNNSSSTQSISDPKSVGVMLYELDRNFDVSGDSNLMVTISDGRYWIGTGSVTSTLPYTIEGNTVHYWTVLYTGNDKRPDGSIGPSPETEHTISLNDLAAKYYSTDEQKQIVDQAVGKIPDIQ